MTPDRQALAAAIAKRTKLADALSRILAAQDPARLRAREAEAAFDKAEQALRTAREAEPRAIASVLVAGGAIERAATLTVNNKVGELDAATEALDLARRVCRALAERERETQAELDEAIAAVKAAATRVVRNSPELAAMMARLRDARRTLAGIVSIGSSILNIMPDNWEVQPNLDPKELSALYITPWRDAIANLETDAGAALPTLDLGAGATSPSAPSPGFLGGSSGEGASSKAARPNGASVPRSDGPGRH